MSKHNELGKDAEILAINFLKKNGYIIVAANYRVGYKEIDIICKDGIVLVFVEVKSRNSTAFGFPEMFVTEQKQAHLKMAAETYLHSMEKLTPSRFDVISVEFTNSLVSKITHFKDAFY